MNIYIEDPIKGQKKVGSLRKGKSGLVFRKNVRRDRHFMKIVQGYAIQKEVFDEYLRGKRGVIQIKELDTRKFLVASIKTWTKHSKTGNYGDGVQIFLGEKFMHGAENFDRNTIIEEHQEDFSPLPSVFAEIKRRYPDLVSKIKST